MELSAPVAALVLVNGAAMLLINALLLLPKIRPFLNGYSAGPR